MAEAHRDRFRSAGRRRGFHALALAFGAWNALGAPAAFGSGVLWGARVSGSAPPAGFLVHGLLFGAVAALAFLAAARLQGGGKRLWVAALVLNGLEWIAGVLRAGLRSDDVVELAVLVIVVLLSLVVLREPCGAA